MRLTVCSLAGAAVLAMGMIGFAAPASAENGVDVTFNASVTNDYVFRGFTQSDGDPAIQAGADLTAGGFYVGTWASNVDFGDGTDWEIDLYGGYRTEVAGLTVDVFVVSYFYFDILDGSEAKIAVSRSFGPATVGAALSYSLDLYGEEPLETFTNVFGSYAATDKLTISGDIGRQTYEVGDEYVTWNVGAVYALTDHLFLDVRYSDTDIKDVPAASDRVAALLKVTF